MPHSRATHSSFKCLFHPGGGTANGCARCASLPTVVPATPRGVHTALRKAKKAVQRRWVSVTNSAPLRLLLLLLATSALLFGVLALVGEPPRAQDTAPGTQRSLRRAAQESVLAAKAALVAAFGHLSQRGSLSNSTHPGPGLRIPRTIHQTVPYGKPGGRAAALRASWERQNPGWRVRLYTDTHAAAFIAAEFPEYLEAYYALPKPAGRADLFRVLVLLRRGGVYADADAGCVRPLDQLLRNGDTLVMGWENTFDAPQQALDRHYVRQRQVLNWAMAGTPGHPALRAAAAAIVARVPEFQHAPDRDADPRAWQMFVLEHSGPGIITDTMLRWYTEQRKNLTADTQLRRYPFWSVRVLPRVVWGTHPRAGSADGVSQSSPEVVVAHKFAGSWKRKQGVERLPWPIRPIARSVVRLRAPPPLPPLAPDVVAKRVKPQPPGTLYPVSCRVPLGPGRTRAWDVLLPPPGVRGVPNCHAQAALHIFNWGASLPRTEPHAVTALLMLGRSTTGVFVDVGAGLGFYALAAASSNRPVVAFEPHGSMIALLRSSVLSNPPLRSRIFMRHQALGAPDIALFNTAWDAAITARQEKLGAAAARGEAAGAQDDAPTAAVELAEHVTSLDAALRNISAGPAPFTVKLTHAAVPLQVALLRVAVRGWEGWVLTGARDILSGSAPPAAVLVECVPDKLARTGWGDVSMLVERMRAWGYTHNAHAGPGCDVRTGTHSVGAKPGSWCMLEPSDGRVLASHVPPGASEALLFSRLSFETLQEKEPQQVTDE